MKGSACIHHRPYLPIPDRKQLSAPYICRIAPFENGFSFSFINTPSNSTSTVWYG